MRKFAPLLLFLLLPCASSGHTINRLFEKLDESISKREMYFENKNDTLITLKNMLAGARSAKEKYDVSKRLMRHYGYYENSSAIYYAGNCLEIARLLNDKGLIAEAELHRADYLRHSGMICESFDILRSIDPEKLGIDARRQYYRTGMFVYSDYAGRLDAFDFRNKYVGLALRNANSYLELENTDSVDYLSVMGYKLFLEKNYRQAAKTIDRLLNRADVSPYQSAEYLYYLGLVYLELGDKYRTNAMDSFLKSAIISNELAITNLLPLLYVGMLSAGGERPDLRRADDYVAISLQNARIFGSKSISDIIETSRFPISEMGLEKSESQKNIYKTLLIIVLALWAISGAVLIVLRRNYRALKSDCAGLRESYAGLADSNRIKESYIKFFLNRNMEYIEEAGRYKKHILKCLNTEDSIEKLKREIAATFNMDDEYSSLLADFDRSVLELCPCFIEGVNSLLKPGQSYATGQGSGNKLNTELRILALVRLGVTDNKQIASFFRITVQSVYNYRSKARGRAIDEETFDDDLAGICM